MVKIRVLKRQDKAYIELPPEFGTEDEVELFSLKEGHYLLTIPLGRTRDDGLTQNESVVLRKLLAIRFENRTPKNVNETLLEAEQSVLKELEQKGLVSVFKGDKYRDGVYSITDRAYKMANNVEQKPTSQVTQNYSGRVTQPVQNNLASLHSNGFMIILDRREAMAISESLNSEMKAGQVIGVKGFDGKFYLVTRNYFSSSEALIVGILKDDMDAPTIATMTKLNPEGCMAVLRLMAENGEIIEKKRGIFAPV